MNLDEPFSNFKSDKNYYPVKNIDSKILIDGKLNEAIWDSLKIIDDFMQADPNIFSLPSQKTSVRIFYNDESLYFGIKIYDDPDKVVGNLAQYDDWFEGFENSSDYFIIEIDSYHDHRTSYAFAVNSAGVKADYMIYDDDPNSIDDDWNQKWNAIVYKDFNSWNIEYEIPFKILKFNNSEEMGINFIRYIKRNNEYDAWVILPREIEGLVSHYGHLKGISIKKKKYLSFKPYFLFGNTDFDDYYYTVTDQNEFNIDDINIINKKINQKMAGLDLQYHINNFSTFSLTINPDFGQIEQDPSEINLTGYESYFEEKRSFFIESSNLFQTPIDIFYSRRIGGDVNLEYNLSNDNDTLLNYKSKLNLAMKLTGKTDVGTSFGVITAESEVDSIYSNFNNEKIYSSVVRVTQDILEGNSYIGFMDVYYKNKSFESNIVSFDGLFKMMNNKLNVDAQIIHEANSHIHKHHNAMGLSFEISFKDKFSNFYNGKILHDKVLESWFNFEIFDEDLEINDLGYLYRNDLKKIIFGASLLKEDKGEFFKNYSFYIQSIISKKRHDDLTLKNSTSINWNSTFNNFWHLNYGFINGLEYFDDRLYDYYLDQIQSELIVKKPSYQQFYIGFGSNPSKNSSFNISMNYFQNKIKDTGFTYKISSIFRPINWINLEFSYSLDINKEKYHFLKVRQLSNSGIRDDMIYQFTKSNNLEKYLTAKASVFFKKNISFELYMEYYTNKNNLSENPDDLSILREENNYSYPIVSDAITLEENYDILYRTNYSSLTTNFVFKWEYKQGSNLYFIYSLYKDVSGVSFNNLTELIDYKYNGEDTAEIFFDKSLYLKIDYWFDI